MKWYVFVVLICSCGLRTSNAQVEPVSLPDAPRPETGTIVGTVIGVDNDTVPGATVVLEDSALKDPRTVLTDQDGSFKFKAVEVGTYIVSVSAEGFANWTSPPVSIHPGQYAILTGIKLQIAAERTVVDVHYDAREVATEQFKEDEKQRIFGIFPNFYVSYDSDPAPFTAKMKFELALKVSVDPITAGGVFLVAGARQAANTPRYGQGWAAYGERVGSTAADGFSDIMIGGAIIPSLLHQDPRYFYQGSGSTGSRIRHAMLSPFVGRGDNGKAQPNYSSLGGDLASSALSNLYYPRANRGPGLVFGNFAIGTAERIGASLAQEFLLGKFTRRSGHIE